MILATVIVLERVSKVFYLYDHPSHLLLQKLRLRRLPGKEFWALRDVSLEVRKGETFAIVGPNGSGKSTLLQIVAGTVKPTLGRVVVMGRKAALLELGAGFNQEFTGRENVFINAELLGLSRAEIQRKFYDIVEFAGIGPFIDRPVKEYSSGMYVRLAFSTAIHVDPEVLIVDEALAVGDAAFSAKCVRKFEELKNKGVTILFVSHDLALVRRLADRAALLWNGRVEALGSPREVVDTYVSKVLSENPTEGQESLAESLTIGQQVKRHGDRATEILAVKLLDSSGQQLMACCNGDILRLRVQARANRNVADVVVGMLIRDRLGLEIFGTNTLLLNQPVGPLETGDMLEVEFEFHCWLSAQEYTVTVATQYRDGRSQDWIEDALQFRVVQAKAGLGFYCPPVSVKTRVFSTSGEPKTESSLRNA